ncbi:MAG: hypothetical protein M3P91_01705 [Actinomycetota bacterium]|nr:hypothetical protein [Actinomycetota bacterium]
MILPPPAACLRWLMKCLQQITGRWSSGKDKLVLDIRRPLRRAVIRVQPLPTRRLLRWPGRNDRTGRVPPAEQRERGRTSTHAEVPTETLAGMIYAHPTFHRAIEGALRDLHQQAYQ